MKISIVIPTYDRPDLTVRTVSLANRVMSESCCDYEIIVCENPSSNNISASELPANCHYYLWNSNVGPYFNWLSALQLAKNEVCLLLFSDDNLIKFNLDILTYNKLIENKIPYSTCVTSIYDDDNNICVGSGLYNDYCRASYSEILIGFLIGERGFPVSPGASFFKKSILIESLNHYAKNFKFGFDNGAGPDLYSYIYPLMKMKISPSGNLSEIIFTAHPGSLSTNPKTSSKVMVNYTLLRLILLQSTPNISKKNKIYIFFRLYFSLGKWNYRIAIKMLCQLFYGLDSKNNILAIFGIPFFLIGVACSVQNASHKKYRKYIELLKNKFFDI